MFRPLQRTQQDQRAFHAAVRTDTWAAHSALTGPELLRSHQPLGAGWAGGHHSCASVSPLRGQMKQNIRLWKVRRILTLSRHLLCFSVLTTSVSQPILGRNGASERSVWSGSPVFASRLCSLGYVWPSECYLALLPLSFIICGIYMGIIGKSTCYEGLPSGLNELMGVKASEENLADGKPESGCFGFLSAEPYSLAMG